MKENMMAKVAREVKGCMATKESPEIRVVVTNQENNRERNRWRLMQLTEKIQPHLESFPFLVLETRYDHMQEWPLDSRESFVVTCLT